MLTPIDRLAFSCATCFGVGLFKFAPGTLAALAALPIHFGFQALPIASHLAAVCAIAAAGIWSAGKVANLLREADPQIVVADELAGALIALLCVPNGGLVLQILAILLFRLLDIIKPWPIDIAEKCRPPGLGIMADDILAGTIAGITVRILSA